MKITSLVAGEYTYHRGGHPVDQSPGLDPAVDPSPYPSHDPSHDPNPGLCYPNPSSWVVATSPDRTYPAAAGTSCLRSVVVISSPAEATSSPVPKAICASTDFFAEAVMVSYP